ncbi:cysteine desulfuration protein SufE [Mesorhizobium albiziae]|uniref:Cysteine desulfuration protein SufE n=2 Tax=Neomesorhizobium albiziae TaxID=335020 RepID=A0A1I4AL99_9HYPH|nr:cysteine desulfuration protein SufE [Mesorhizobium albiziae]
MVGFENRSAAYIRVREHRKRRKPPFAGRHHLNIDTPYIRFSMATTITEIFDDFAFLDEWEDRYRYVIELGQALPPFPEAARTDVYKVPGCVSQVWLTTNLEAGPDPIVTFAGDSDAHIVKGLVAIMLALFSGRRASEIVGLDAEATLRKLGLDEHLTPQRANGLRSMVKRIKRDAVAALEPAE